MHACGETQGVLYVDICKKVERTVRSDMEKLEDEVLKGIENGTHTLYRQCTSSRR